MNLIELPSPPTAVVAFSPPPVVSIALPSAPVSQLPAGFIPMVPAFTALPASGSGTSSVAVTVTSGMSGAGAGVGQVAPRGTVSAAASGAGKMSVPAFVVGQAFPTSIEADGAGDTVVRSAAGSGMAATGVGALAMSPGTTISAAGLSSTVMPVAGAVRATATGLGTSVAASAPRITAAATGAGTATVTGFLYAGAGMDKSGNQTLPGSTWTQITSWTARSGSTVASNGLMLPANISATAVVQVTYGGSNAVNACRILANGVVVGTSPAGGQTPTGTFAIPAAGTEQLITVEGYVAGLTGGRAVAASGTFLTLA